MIVHVQYSQRDNDGDVVEAADGQVFSRGGFPADSYSPTNSRCAASSCRWTQVWEELQTWMCVKIVLGLRQKNPWCRFSYLRHVEQVSSEVVVGAQCGSAVLRGAHVFAPGIVASPKCRNKTVRFFMWNGMKSFEMACRYESWGRCVRLLWFGGSVHPRSHKLPGEKSICGKWSCSDGPLQHLLLRRACQVWWQFYIVAQDAIQKNWHILQIPIHFCVRI